MNMNLNFKQKLICYFNQIIIIEHIKYMYILTQERQCPASWRNPLLFPLLMQFGSSDWRLDSDDMTDVISFLCFLFFPVWTENKKLDLLN